jgi:beta,beta-carotene 9',10'-dioxygenase
MTSRATAYPSSLQPTVDAKHESAEAQSRYGLGFTTLAAEVSNVELPVRGTVPDWLVGTLLRTGPARFEVGSTKLNHWFDGLAMLHRFAFSNCGILYSNRYLHSRAHDEAIANTGITRREFATDPCWNLFQRVMSWFSPKFTDNGCVNATKLGDTVVALTETRMPVRFDPQTLATLGVAEYDRRIPGLISTAHPHFDRVRGRHYNYILDFGRQSQYCFFGIDRTGAQSIVTTIPVARPAYVHSFGMTENYLVLAEFPFVVNPLRLLFSGKPFICNYRWEPDRGVRFHIVEKDGGRVIRTARTDAQFAFHHVNAFEKNGDVVVDLVSHPDATVIDELYLDRLRSPHPVHATGKLTRFRIGATENVSGELLSDVPLELPRFDYRRFTGRPYRYVYGAGNVTQGEFIDSLVKLDLGGASDIRWQEAGCYPGEPVFVAAPEATDEDDGVMLSVVLDIRAGASFLLILDAHTFTELARATAPHHIPFGFHGNFLAPSVKSMS